MNTLFLVCAVAGGAILLVQLVLSVFGFAGDVHADLHHDTPASEGLNLLSVRAVAAGAAFFGLTGLAMRGLGLGPAGAALAALVGGGLAMVAVAMLMRAMVRMEDDGSVRIENSLGATGTVYLSVPGQKSGLGKVHLSLQGRTVELQALTASDALPTGARVVIVDTVGPDTVEVAPEPDLGGLLDARV